MSYDTLPFADQVWLKQSYGLPTWSIVEDRAAVRYLRADLAEQRERNARLAALREVREHFMAWHKLELGFLIGGSLEGNAVTKIFALFLNQIDFMIAKEEGK